MRHQTILAALFVSGLSAPAQAQAPEVEVMRLELGRAELTDTYFGTVRATELTSLSYGVRGGVTQVSADAKRSRTVAAGVPLVELDAQRAQLDLRSAEARVLDLEAAMAERALALEAAMADNRRRAEELDFVTEEFERNSTMLGRGLINETTMETIERRFMETRFTAERAVEAIATAEAAMRRAEIALEIGRLDLELAGITLDDYTVSAPFAGVLVGFEVNDGDCVQEGGLAAQIYRPDEKSVDVFFLISRLSAPHAAGLGMGGSVTVTRVNGAACGGTITRVDSQADSETQFVEATVDLDASCAPDLFLNEAVEVEAVQSAVDGAYTVPNSALTRDGLLMLVDEETQLVEAARAEVVLANATHSIVKLDGADGRLLVVSGQRGLETGTKVALPGSGS